MVRPDPKAGKPGTAGADGGGDGRGDADPRAARWHEVQAARAAAAARRGGHAPRPERPQDPDPAADCPPGGSETAGAVHPPEPPARPRALDVVPDNIPEGLKALPCWVVWRYTSERDPETGQVDWGKPPLVARNGLPASSTNRKTWGPFARALAAYRRGGLDGLGLALDPQEDGRGEVLIAIDLDHCRNPETGAVEAWAQAIIYSIASYCEVSPSGTGIRIFLRGPRLKRGRKRGPVEVYCWGRYVTCTGHHLDGTPATVESRAEALAAFLAAHFPEPPPVPPGPTAAPAAIDLDDAEVIRRASASESGAKFRALWEGSTHGYPSGSEADLALCSHLAFWCGPNSADRIDALFRASGLFRAKWQRQDYKARTIAKALQGPRDFWDPHHAGKNGTPRRRAQAAASPSVANGRAAGQDGAPEPDCDPGPGPAARDPVHMTDTGNGRRLVRDHGGDLRYCHPWASWLCWDGRRWRPDDTGEATRRAKRTVADLFAWTIARMKDIRRELEGTGE